MRRSDSRRRDSGVIGTMATSSDMRLRRRGGLTTVRVLVFVVIVLMTLVIMMARVILSDKQVLQDTSARHRGLATGVKDTHPAALRRVVAREPLDVNLTLAQLKELKAEERLGLLHHLREGQFLLQPGPTQMHGLLGLDDDALPYWKPRGAPPKDLNMAQELRRGGGFNLRLSDALPLDRVVRDGRHAACKAIKYDMSTLTDATVIIVFHNEPFSTLMRSVHSVLNLTPPSLLREIVLVDDGSTLEWIKESGSGELEDYVQLLPKVHLIRLPERRGIVAARMAGIRAAKAPIFVILDSHIEVQSQWLEPLIARIQEDRTRVLMPQVDGLNAETFTEEAGGIGCTLTFLWKLIEHGYDPDDDSTDERRDASPTDFVSSPTMAGGLFAANVDFFLNDLNGYDELFQYWGTENLEISFRIWMCGGRLECAPCSRVYHIFRKGGQGYTSPPFSTLKNKMRTLAVWMDEYADLAWRVAGSPAVDFGPYEDLLEWRKTKQCKNFQWFLDNVNPEQFVRAMPDDVPYLGPIVNVKSGKCLDTQGNDQPERSRLKPYACHGGHNQDFMFFRRVGHIMPVSNDENCLATSRAGATAWCYKGKTRWSVKPIVGDNIVQLEATVGRCLADVAGQLRLAACDENDTTQHWSWPTYNPPRIWTPPPPSDAYK